MLSLAFLGLVMGLVIVALSLLLCAADDSRSDPWRCGSDPTGRKAGKSVLPGFIDAPTHIEGIAVKSGEKSLEKVRDRVHSADAGRMDRRSCRLLSGTHAAPTIRCHPAAPF